MENRYCIIGASAAGIAAANKIRQLDAHASIICFSAEGEDPYNKCFLADYVANLKPESALTILSSSAAKERNITLKLGCRIELVDCKAREIVDVQGERYAYDKLLIATGAQPFIPPNLATIASGLFPFHTSNNIAAMLAYTDKHAVQTVLVVGGGLTGVEAADALRARGVNVVIVELATHLLSAFINAPAGNYVKGFAQSSQVKVYEQSAIDRVITVDGRIAGVQLTSGLVIDAQMIVCATGQRPNNDLAKKTGLVMQGNYLLVDEFQCTSDPRIFAAGDCILAKNEHTGNLMPSVTWADAMQQGMVAAHAMVLGQQRPYRGIIPLLTSSFFGAHFVVGGLRDAESKTLDEHELVGDVHYELLVFDTADRLVHFVFIGNNPERLRAMRIAYMTGSVARGLVVQ